ncbi:CaiB/BaiF CoA-transferase family protein [Pusillimonas sp. SM2304]|uniref:CaiB/BaiF CoA transferase family protein n=1 Tax=Pusillimonas sp. SM2304 TaxID=3073241 RepID=UPI002875753D|nr:CaiB/BaiF CoA-transferase family protein [Pusillimonas sp. SM2304]MDS1141845.1 CaiB/BaiF CoA-transferase family protein [Pusillimonas sp. SM2304]
MKSTNKPLTGIRVADFTRILAGPYCAQLLGDLGAEIVKVEIPQEGDPLRTQGPPFHEGNGLTYYAANRNKRSIALDMRTDRGKAIARELCLKADVVLENFRPGVMQRLGLDYDSLALDNPRLVYASMSGFGADGPDSMKGAFDLTIQAVGGYMNITGDRGGAPIKMGTSAFDIITGTNCYAAVLAALLQRTVSGRGQRIETSLLESEVAFLANAALEYLILGREPEKWGSEHAQQVPYKAFRSQDGWIVIGAGFSNLFAELCKVLKRQDLISDPRFIELQDRVNNRDELYAILDAEIVRHRTEELVAKLDAAKVPCSVVNNMKGVFSHPQVRHRQMEQRLHHEQYGEIPTLGPAVKFSAFDITDGWSAPPVLGEHTHEVLHEWLGYDPEQVAELRDSGVI